MHLNLMKRLVLPLLPFAPPGGADELLELACITDAQCAQFERGHCVDMACTCLPHEEKLTNIIGGPCPCPQPKAECDIRRDQCICHMGYVHSVDRRRCLPEAANEDISAHKARISCEPIVTFGATCRHNADCRMEDVEQEDHPVGMVCKWGECSCSDTHRLRDNHCIPMVKMGATHHRTAGLLLPGFTFALQSFFIGV